MTFKFECEICHCGPNQNISIFRTGGKGPGEDPHWRCQHDLGLKINNPEIIAVVELVAMIESDSKTKH